MQTCDPCGRLSLVVLLEGTSPTLKNAHLDQMWCQVELLRQVLYFSLYLTEVCLCQYSDVYL